MELSKTLPSLNERQQAWAIEHCFKKKAFTSGRKAWCLTCGHQFPHEPIKKDGDKLVCPHCGREVEVESTRTRSQTIGIYFSIITTKCGFQVLRHFVVYLSSKIEEEATYDFREVVQNWLDENGRETIIARGLNMSWYCDWNFNVEMSIKVRTPNAYYRGYRDVYDINPAFIYPSRSILPIIKRNGYFGIMDSVPPNVLFKALLTSSDAEMLAKTGQHEILSYLLRSGEMQSLENHRHAVRIANRNGYKVKDASLWFDLLNLLDYLHLDTHNAHYVCPIDLHADHDRYLARKERMEAEKKRLENIEKAKQWEDEYRKTKGAYFGICFGNEDIMVTVITSVAEMAEEGTAMHHCVFASEYFKKPDSLILSARKRDGERLETIEFSLKTMEVLQCRGLQNKSTPYHDTILKLMKDNVHLIRKVPREVEAA